MSDALEEHDGKVSIGRRNITNLRFADDRCSGLGRAGARSPSRKSQQRLLNISYKDHVTFEEVHRKVQAAIGEFNELTLVKKMEAKMVWPCCKVLWFSKDNPTGHS